MYPDIIGCVWTGKFDLNTLRVDGEIFESGKKKLRIQKYPDTCGRGFSHFTRLFCRRRQRNVQRFITHVQKLLFFSLNLLFSDVAVAVAVVDCLRSLFKGRGRMYTG